MPHIAYEAAAEATHGLLMWLCFSKVADVAALVLIWPRDGCPALLFTAIPLLIVSSFLPLWLGAF
jgi:hypothetical protein